MRDINRIEPFMAEITQLWKTKCPDMRFCQFMSNILGELYSVSGTDPFFIEDGKALNLIKDIPWLSNK